ncbi:MAG: TonB-dependent receptor, partial [Sphingomonas sp.]
MMATVAAAAIACSAPAAAQVRDYNVPAESASKAIATLAKQGNVQILLPGRTAKRIRTRAVTGAMSVEDALATMLAGTGLRAQKSGGQTWIIVPLEVAQVDAVPRSGQASPSAGDASLSTRDDLGEIIVTGTRIRGRGPVGSPVVTIDRKAIDESGYATTQQIAQSIPQNFMGGINEATAPGGTVGANTGANGTRGSSINLRGLGPTSTLVLLNGERPPLGGFAGAFADISMIPASAIERVEIVADGASAIYGSDAVAGVVNIVPRLDFTGVEASARIGTADGDSQEYQASLLLGKRWSGGHAMIAYEFYHRDPLRAADRPFATDDLRPYGGIDHRAAYADPGTIYAGGKSFAIPAGQNGIGLTAARLTAGTVNLADSWIGADILPQQQRHSVFAAVRQDLASNLRFHANALMTIRTFDEADRPGRDARRTVPVTNAFYVDPIGTHQPVGVQYGFQRDLGNESRRGIASAYGGTAGLEAKVGPWSVNANATYGRDYERYTGYNLVNTARLALALADPNPATAYNLFGDGPATNPA